MNEANKLWWRSVGPSLAVIALVGIVNGAWVYRQHRDGSQNDVAQLLWPAHYVVQKPEQGAFDDACVSAGWAELTRGAKPSFAPGVDRERALGILPVDAATQLRVSLREPKPRPSVLQIEFVGAVPKSGDDASLAVAKRVFTTIDEACGVPYVAPAECGAISTPACRAFRAP